MREKRRDRLRLQHIHDACELLIEFMADRTEEDLQTGKLLLSAVTRQLEIIGEAANMLTEEFRDDHSEIPWRQIIGMRHKMIHEYFLVQSEVVWDVVTNDVPVLDEQVKHLLAKLSDQGF